MTSSLDRVKAFKNAIHKSAWYYTLINRMISENIHEAPLAKFMAGKLIAHLYYANHCYVFADQIKNVIESGQVYSTEHFESLLSSMSQRDFVTKEVQTYVIILYSLRKGFNVFVFLCIGLSDLWKMRCPKKGTES